MKALRLLSVLLWLSAVSCVTPFDTGIRQTAPQLVVDGLITDQPGPYRVKLTYTAAYTNSSQGSNLLVSGAKVSITDDQGGNYALLEKQLGIYQTDSMALRGVIGRTYQLHIVAPDGNAYQSKPELLKSVAPIDTMYWEYQNGNGAQEVGIHVYINTRDPATEGDYYRWQWTHYENAIYNCSPCWDIFRCYGCATVLSDVNVNGNAIIRQPVLVAPFDGWNPYYLEITQSSLTREAYRFWKTAAEQSKGSSGPFDAPPAPVPGNIDNLTRPEVTALGFFGASGVSTRHYWIDRSNIPDTPPLKDPPPSGPGPCVPCEESVIRTKIKPRFWDN
jgi:hypothetical protein